MTKMSTRYARKNGVQQVEAELDFDTPQKDVAHDIEEGNKELLNTVHVFKTFSSADKKLIFNNIYIFVSQF